MATVIVSRLWTLGHEYARLPYLSSLLLALTAVGVVLLALIASILSAAVAIRAEPGSLLREE